MKQSNNEQSITMSSSKYDDHALEHRLRVQPPVAIHGAQDHAERLAQEDRDAHLALARLLQVRDRREEADEAQGEAQRVHRQHPLLCEVVDRQLHAPARDEASELAQPVKGRAHTRQSEPHRVPGEREVVVQLLQKRPHLFVNTGRVTQPQRVPTCN